MKVEELVGKTFISVTRTPPSASEDRILFVADDGSSYCMYHCQDCCETVQIEDIAGSLEDLVGSPILQAEEVTSKNIDPEGVPVVHEYPDESCTWTFYKFATVKGYVTIRWYGTSNGYYSEGVDLEQLQ